MSPAGCEACEFVAKSPGGLASHVRAKHPVEDERGVNRRAVDATLGFLAGMGRLEDVDAALVQAVRSMADELDVDAGNAALWRQYREGLEDLVKVDDDVSHDLSEAFEALERSSPVGDPAEA